MWLLPLVIADLPLATEGDSKHHHGNRSCQEGEAEKGVKRGLETRIFQALNFPGLVSSKPS